MPLGFPFDSDFLIDKIKTSSTPKMSVISTTEEQSSNLTPGATNFSAGSRPSTTNGLLLKSFLLKGCNSEYNKKLARRRTNPIKEVERLEKNREERRIRNAESREEKKSLMKKDPGNVNWEFSAMIKYILESLFLRECLNYFIFIFFREFCSSLDYHPIRDNDFLDRESSDSQITVCVRKRPMNKKELDLKEVDIVSIPDKQKIIVHEPKLKVSSKWPHLIAEDC